MNALTLEWIEKAENDFTAAGVLMNAREGELYDAVCFHAQQCAEKYLKAFLQENNQPIPKIHHLAEILTLVVQVDLQFQELLPALEILEDFAVDFRYPGLKAEKEDAETAYKSVKEVRKFIQAKLGLG